MATRRRRKKKKRTLAQRRKARKKRLAKARALGTIQTKRPKTKAEKLVKKERQAKYRWVFRHGKQVRILREPTIEGLSPDEFIEQNADPIFLLQNEMWDASEADDEDHPWDSAQAWRE